MKENRGNPLAVAVAINRPAAGPTPAQTLDDKIQEIQALGFHGLTFEILTEDCHTVYEKLIDSGKKPNLARREMSKRIQNLPQSWEQNHATSEEINSVLTGVPRSQWMMRLDLGGSNTKKENDISDACCMLEELSSVLFMRVAEYRRRFDYFYEGQDIVDDWSL